jgi:hypothetical protein
MVQPFLIAESTWVELKDGDDSVRELYEAHYSRHRYQDGRRPKLFVGPGEKMVLMTPDARAIFAWRKFRSDDGQVGINNSIFRNSGPELSSALILEAMKLAWERWPGLRLYTYVDPRKVRSSNPGYCYMRAGWRKCGITKWNKLLIFEALPC